jgi:cobalt-zinc-cadmium efflux system protein
MAGHRQHDHAAHTHHSSHANPASDLQAGRETQKRRLAASLAITGLWFVAELAGGFYTNSLALIADAAHMLTDFGALGLSLFAITIAGRPATHQKTFGYLRAEILAALANGVFLVLVAAYIFYEAYGRLLSPPVVRSGPMLAIAGVGLAANLLTAGMLYGSQHGNLNIRAAFLHVVGDTLGSVGTIVAGLLMLFAGWYTADPAVSAIVGLLVLYSSVKLVRESVDVLLEGTPRNIDVSRILSDLGSIEGVVSVHDLHVWSISSQLPALSCHLVLWEGADSREVLAEAGRRLREAHGIRHTTVQIEQESWRLTNVVQPTTDSRP